MYKMVEVFIGSTKLPFTVQDFLLEHKFRNDLTFANYLQALRGVFAGSGSIRFLKHED